MPLIHYDYDFFSCEYVLQSQEFLIARDVVIDAHAILDFFQRS